MSITKQQSCPICKIDPLEVQVWDYGERISLECPRCGKFTITRTGVSIAERRELGPKLSAWIRERSESGADIPELNSNMLEGIESALPNYSVSEKQLLLMRAFERRTKFPGQEIDIVSQYDYPLAWAAGEGEFRYLVHSLIERRLVSRTDGPGHLRDSFVHKLEITADGWTFLDDHARSSVIGDQVFVAMSFSAELNSAWEAGIRPALERAQFRPYRVDAEPHIDRIDMKIITEIKNSKFVVADVTEQRPGVYFEAGYALGLGLPVIWCVRSDDLANVHFDTRQYNHIIWDNEAYLADQLYFYVTALIGKGATN